MNRTGIEMDARRRKATCGDCAYVCPDPWNEWMGRGKPAFNGFADCYLHSRRTRMNRRACGKFERWDYPEWRGRTAGAPGWSACGSARAPTRR